MKIRRMQTPARPNWQYEPHYKCRQYHPSEISCLRTRELLVPFDHFVVVRVEEAS